MNDILKVIGRFRREEHFGFAVLAIESTYKASGPRAAMAHARRIAAAYKNLRAHRVESKTQALKRQADRQGLRYV